MKKLLIVAGLFVFVVAGAFAFQFSDFQAAFQTFADKTASALPLEASVGLNWSDAYIGQFPHFGLGATLGAATLPYSAIEGAINTFSPSGLPSDVSFLKTLGVPVPAYTFDLRIGGFVWPFDIGFKFGYLPPNALSAFSNVSADYLLLGGDIRYALVKDQGWAPGISLGVGYTYMRGNVSVPGVFSGNIQIANVQAGSNTYYLQFTNPSLNMFWNSNVIDLKIQVSKNLFIITPFVGLGVSYGISNAGGGMQSAMQVSTDNGATYHNVTQTELDTLNTNFHTNFTLQNPGFAISSSANGFATRAFGGLSLNLFIIKLGIGAEYEFLSGSFAGMMNLRLQF
ncbi:MAG TPA: hypothetical protein VL354_00350 [Spirochaetia bacterium]|nr:hypothetical protein [Spirochaetia bacterium]